MIYNNPVCITSASLELVAAGISTSVSCARGNNGAISLAVSGGVAPYIVLWGNGMTGASISGLTAGNYTATITDAQGGSATVMTTVNVSDNLAPVATVATLPTITGQRSATGNSPEGACPICWGHSEWDGHHYKVIKDKYLTSGNEVYESFISKIADQHTKTTHKNENKYICTTCDKEIES
jgi:ribosomal protein L44E